MYAVNCAYWAEERRQTCWCSCRFGVGSRLMGMSVCCLTTQAVHLLLLQQADSIVLSIQYQLRLRVLAGHSVAAENFLQLDPVVLIINCQQMQSRRKTTRSCTLPSVVRSICQSVLALRHFNTKLKKGELLNKDNMMFNCLSPTNLVENTTNNFCIHKKKKSSAILLTLRPTCFQYSISKLKRMKQKNAQSAEFLHDMMNLMWNAHLCTCQRVWKNVKVFSDWMCFRWLNIRGVSAFTFRQGQQREAICIFREQQLSRGMYPTRSRLKVPWAAFGALKRLKLSRQHN